MNTRTLQNLSRTTVALTTLFAAVPASAEDYEHPEAHTDIALGLGVLSPGVGLTVGYRADFDLKVEGRLGTALFASGASVAAGYSPRVYDGTDVSIEVPVLAYFLGGNEATFSEDSDSEPFLDLGLVSGADFLFGGTASVPSRFLIGVRAGFMYDTGQGWVLPMGQLDFGVAY